MKRFNIFVKSGVAIATGLFSILTENFGIPFAVLTVLIILDFVSGFPATIYSKERLGSHRGGRWLVKKVAHDTTCGGKWR